MMVAVTSTYKKELMDKINAKYPEVKNLGAVCVLIYDNGKSEPFDMKIKRSISDAIDTAVEMRVVNTYVRIKVYLHGNDLTLCSI